MTLNTPASPLRALLLGLLAAGLSGGAAAQSPSCATWGVLICSAVTTAAYTDARVFWSDESVTQRLTLTTHSNDVVRSGSRETGVLEQVFSRPGFTGNLGYVSTDPQGRGPTSLGQLYGVGRGPGAVVTYQVEKAPAGLPVVHHVNSYIGQANGGALGGTGSAADQNNLEFVTDGQADFGVNRAATLVQGYLIPPQAFGSNNTIKPGLSGTAKVSAHADTRSIWSDTLNVGGAAGGVVTFNVLVEGRVSKNAFARYSLSLGRDATGSLIDETISHNNGAPDGYFSRTLTASLDVVGASTIQLTGVLQARVDLPDAYDDPSGSDVLAFADFYNTARVTAITLSPGLTASYGSGSANLINITHVSSVPEPSATWLLLGGSVLLWVSRARRPRPA